ncbi:hypothetical protein BDK51DRAFT_26343 [Blyttiomyces helicus]|uniref:Uncharacterized protein n=1 Tax=Blyttiomyces helicus TaxID=388810 RepID=A0A4V1ISP1_9FUNG|nr:hypothetical protein BDK51DRAFT_26343 [Blyttiomyces helicus]|eukprot:RKO94237.1 hypothetical protein BDK51DRAFT_26343 [Blyttiomyces helicus]
MSKRNNLFQSVLEKVKADVTADGHPGRSTNQNCNSGLRLRGSQSWTPKHRSRKTGLLKPHIPSRLSSSPLTLPMAAPHPATMAATPSASIPDSVSETPDFSVLADNSFPVLQTLTLKNPDDYGDLEGSLLESFSLYHVCTRTNDNICSHQQGPPHHGLTRAYELALGLLRSDYVLAHLRETFTDPPPLFNDYARSVLDRGFSIILSNNTNTQATGSHSPPPDGTKYGLPINHVILAKKDVETFLPRTPASAWTPADLRAIFTIAWWMTHELCHAVGSSLYAAHAIKDHLTPRNIIPFTRVSYAKTTMAPDGDIMVLGGERGYWIEEKLGGVLRCVLAEGTSDVVEEVLLDCAGNGVYFGVPDAVIADWVARAGPQMRVKKIVIEAPPTPLPLARRERIKGRAPPTLPNLVTFIPKSVGRGHVKA